MSGRRISTKLQFLIEEGRSFKKKMEQRWTAGRERSPDERRTTNSKKMRQKRSGLSGVEKGSEGTKRGGGTNQQAGQNFIQSERSVSPRKRVGGKLRWKSGKENGFHGQNPEQHLIRLRDVRHSHQHFIRLRHVGHSHQQQVPAT